MGLGLFDEWDYSAKISFRMVVSILCGHAMQPKALMMVIHYVGAWESQCIRSTREVELEYMPKSLEQKEPRQTFGCLCLVPNGNMEHIEIDTGLSLGSGR